MGLASVDDRRCVDAAVDGEELLLRYTLSTWNPYQVVLMAHRLPIAAL